MRFIDFFCGKNNKCDCKINNRLYEENKQLKEEIANLKRSIEQRIKDSITERQESKHYINELTSEINDCKKKISILKNTDVISIIKQLKDIVNSI